MSTRAAIATAPWGATPTSGAPVGYRTTWASVLRSEWIRLVTIRANIITLGAAAFAMVAVGLIAAATSTGAVQGVGPGGQQGPGLSGTDPLTTVLAGQTPVVLVLGILGVLIGAREYGSGLVRTTMAAVPSRLPVLASRVVVFVAAALPVMVAATLMAYAGGSAILAGADADFAAWGDPGVPRAVIGTAAYLVGIGVLGICLGMLTRSLGQGIGWLVGLVLVIPGFGQLLLPKDWREALDYLPSNAGTSLTSLTDPTDALSITAGALVYVAWLLAGILAAGAALRVRDV